MTDDPNISTINGDDLIKKHNIKTIDDRIFLYRNGYYKIDENEDLLHKEIRDLLEGDYTTHYVKETINYIRDSTRLIDFEPLPHISLRNKILNTEDMTFQEPTPNLFITNRINVEFNPSASTDEWEKYISQIIPDDEHQLILQEFIGYSFILDQRCKKLMYVIGPRDSGKSSLFNILTDFFGEENCSHLQLSELMQRFQNYGIYNKMVNIRADIDCRIPLQSVNLIKSLTGDDKILIEQKYHNPIEYRNRAKILLSGNGIPQIPFTADDAFFARWLIIVCPNIFIAKNPTFYKKFTTPKAKSAILNWALQGLVRLKENNWIFTYSPSSEEIKEWFKSGNIMTTVENFLSKKCYRDKNEYEFKDVLYEHYQKWCNTNGIIILHPNVFHREVKNNNIIPVEQYRPRLEDGSQQYAWKGLWLRNKS